MNLNTKTLLAHTAVSAVVVFAVAVLFFAVNTPASAHSVSTASGANVNHDHYASGSCHPTFGCAASDSTFESAYSFSSSDRWYSTNWAWNCHGRTFDARNSWIHLAEPYLDNDGPYSPASPGYGDAVIWWDGGQTSHSVTVVGSWNGLSTATMSKYGAQGQYRHALSNPVVVYGSNWAVTNFGSGTTIYAGLTSEPDTPSKRSAKPVSGLTAEELLEQRKQMPWYEDVLKSEALYAVEHPRLVRRITQLTEEGKKRFLEATGDQERVEALLSDFRDASHYKFLSAYNHPSFSEDFIMEIEAGQLLVQMVEKRPETRQMVVDGLTDVLLTEKSRQGDRIRGASVHFLSQLLDEESRRLVKSDLMPAVDALAKSEVSYFAYYLSKM